jgi:TolA-binding protein
MSFECRSDRVSGARRGTLSSSERLAFEAHVQVCESCRLALEIGADFDALAAPAWDDGARIERLAARMIANQRRARGRRLARAPLLAACVLLFTGVAAATALGWLSPRRPVLVAAPNASMPRAGAGLGEALPVVMPTVTAPSAEPAASEEATQARSEAPAQAQSIHTGALPPSASRLFRGANEARRAGQSQKAIQIYRALQHDYQASPEAVLSLVSLGGLLLNGDPPSAMDQFDRYLLASPNGALAAEALYGRGRALQALGRRTEERTTWSELLARYPKTPYRERATLRLAELR